MLALPRGAPHLFLHGRIDLLGRRGGRRVIRDYKYARPHATATERHARQLAAYRLAVGGAADTELVFLRGGTVVRRLPDMDDAAEEDALAAC